MQCSSREADLLRVDIKSVKNNLQGKTHFNTLLTYYNLVYTFEFAFRFVRNRNQNVSNLHKRKQRIFKRVSKRSLDFVAKTVNMIKLDYKRATQ